MLFWREDGIFILQGAHRATASDLASSPLTTPPRKPQTAQLSVLFNASVAQT